MFFGFATSNDKFLLNSFQIYPYLSIAFIAPAILMGIIYPKKLRHIKSFLQKTVLIKIVLLCIVYGISEIAFYLALKTGNNSSQIASINLTGVIVTVLLAIIFLKERTHLVQKLLGAVVAFIELFLIS